MMNQQYRMITIVAFILMLAVQWLCSGGAFAAGEEINIATENLPDTVTNEPKAGHEKDVFKNLIGMAFVSISRGKFIMGSPSSEPGRTIFEVQNEVFIDKSFYIQKTEVTQRQWEEVMGDNPSYFSECGEDCPVENVSWVDAQNFIKKLSQMDSSNIYRLPTESEWEFACRSGNSVAFSNGDVVQFECNKDNILNEVAWYHCNSQGKTHPVGQKASNNWGVYDMHGNVYEWCHDVYVTDYTKVENGKINEIDPIADRVGRSCSYDDSAVSCRSAARANFNPNIRSNTIGFRLVREPLYYKIKMPPSGEKLTISDKNANELETVQPRQPIQSKKIEKEKRITLQVAAMKDEKNADQLVAQLKEKGYAAYKSSSKRAEKGTWYLVRIGVFESIKKAQQIQMDLAEDNIQSIIVKNLNRD
jgi:formylglycine-generating enzyme required for sulfatase activity